MPDLPITARQLGIILFWGGFSWWAFRWAWRNAKSQATDQDHGKPDPE